MENENIIIEDATVVAEEIVPSDNGKGLLIAMGVTGAIGLAIYGTYQLVKFIKKKKATKKEEKEEETLSIEENVFDKDLDEE